MDETTWAALAFVLAAIGAGWTWQAFRRYGVASGVRGAALTLVPIALWLTGTLQLAGDIVGDVTDWASGLVFSPAVWLGVILAGLAVVLFGASTVMKNKGVGTRGAVRASDASKQITAARAPRAGDQPILTGVDDDVAAILRKHGIS